MGPGHRASTPEEPSLITAINSMPEYLKKTCRSGCFQNFDIKKVIQANHGGDLIKRHNNRPLPGLGNEVDATGLTMLGPVDQGGNLVPSLTVHDQLPPIQAGEAQLRGHPMGNLAGAAERHGFDSAQSADLPVNLVAMGARGMGNERFPMTFDGIGIIAQAKTTHALGSQFKDPNNLEMTPPRRLSGKSRRFVVAQPFGTAITKQMFDRQIGKIPLQAGHPALDGPHAFAKRGSAFIKGTCGIIRNKFY